jgi:hypothetical protein
MIILNWWQYTGPYPAFFSGGGEESYNKKIHQRFVPFFPFLRVGQKFGWGWGSIPPPSLDTALEVN